MAAPSAQPRALSELCNNKLLPRKHAATNAIASANAVACKPLSAHTRNRPRSCPMRLRANHCPTKVAPARVHAPRVPSQPAARTKARPSACMPRALACDHLSDKGSARPRASPMRLHAGRYPAKAAPVNICAPRLHMKAAVRPMSHRPRSCVKPAVLQKPFATANLNAIWGARLGCRLEPVGPTPHGPLHP